MKQVLQYLKTGATEVADVFQWFLKGHFFNVVSNGRAKWKSLIAMKDPSQRLQYGKYIRNQPYATGIEGNFSQKSV